MRKPFVFILFLFWLISLSAQNQKTVNVNFGDTLNRVLDMGFQYLYPEFIPGTVYFTDNQKTSAILNYNVLANEIHFIDRNDLGDGVAMTEDELMKIAQSLVLTDVDYVVIGENYFVNTPRGIMYLVENRSVMLLRKDLIKINSRSNIGAYGIQSQSSSIEARGRLSSPETSASEGYEPQIVTEYKRTTEFYMFDGKKVIPANFRGFRRLFKENRDDMEQFVAENDIDFKAETDLVKLINYCLDL